MVSPTLKRHDECMNLPDRNARPVLICYDGSEDAKHAIQQAGGLLAARPALVITVWQETAALDSFAWDGETSGMANFVELDRAGAEDAGRIADEGVRRAYEGGLEAERVAIKATGPIWNTIVETADRHDAAAIVMGSRGLTGVRSILLGSVSNAVVHHADRPTVVVPRGAGDADRDSGQRGDGG
jgi:nucleotide-binding universal stress UspA family protein